MSKILHYRATFDVDVRVRPLTRAFLERRAREWRRRASVGDFVPTPSPLPADEELEPLRALQSELCRDEPLLRDWMASGVTLSLQEGEGVSEDVELEDAYDLLPGLAEHVSPRSRRKVHEDLADPSYSVCLDEFWFSFRAVPGRIDIGLRAALPSDPDQVVGRRFRVTVPFTVEVDEAEDVSVQRIVRRRFQAARVAVPFVDDNGLEWPPPLPDERDLDPTRELLCAAHAAPLTVDRIVRLDIVAGIRDGLLSDVGPRPLETDALLHLLDRLSPAHRAYLLRPPLDSWSDRLWDVVRSFEEEFVATTVMKVRG